jgi:hypothetical protein
MCKPDIKIKGSEVPTGISVVCRSSLYVKAALGVATNYCLGEFLEYQNSISYQRIVPEFVCGVKERSCLARIGAVKGLNI